VLSAVRPRLEQFVFLRAGPGSFFRALGLFRHVAVFRAPRVCHPLQYAELFQVEPLKVAIRQFFVARFARLYPLYAVAVFCSLPMIPVPFSKWVVLSYLTMTQSWFNVE
jgi:hypothetical protein